MLRGQRLTLAGPALLLIWMSPPFEHLEDVDTGLLLFHPWRWAVSRPTQASHNTASDSHIGVEHHNLTRLSEVAYLAGEGLTAN
jgi:hypothetical protein